MPVLAQEGPEGMGGDRDRRSWIAIDRAPLRAEQVHPGRPYWCSRCLRKSIDVTSIMVRMLVADDATKLVRPVVLQRGLARQVGDADHPAEPGFGAELLGWYHPVRPVEGAGHDLDPRAVDAAEAERGAAIPAEIALGDRGGAERGRP